MSTAEQLALPVLGQDWFTGWRPDRSGAAAYVVIVRAPEDPERTPRAETHARLRAAGLDMDEWSRMRQTVGKSAPEDWHERILGDLRANGPSTLNAVGVRLLDKTADMLLGTPFEEAFWQLCEAGRVAYATPAPVRWRAL